VPPPLCQLMRQALSGLALVFVLAVTACSQDAGRPYAFRQVSDAEFRQPLPEPPLHQVGHPPAASVVFADVAGASMQSAAFQIVGTEPAPRVQGQIGAQVYHQDGTLTTGPPALELQPLSWYQGADPDIDGRGDYVVIGSTVYQRVNSLNEWRLSPIDAESAWSSAYINPATWPTSSRQQFLGESSINRSATWVVEATDAIGRRFRAWIRETDGYPLRYSTSWVNAKGRTYYINALYLRFNTQVSIPPPSQSNHGMVSVGAPIQLASGSVTVAGVDFDCSGTATRRPGANHKFVTLSVAFNDTGPAAMPITPDAWRLYGDETDGAVPVDTGGSTLLREQVLQPGHRASGVVAFEVAEDAYQLWTVGKFPDVTAVVNVSLPIYPSGVSPCA
jgi:hypothetical protein